MCLFSPQVYEVLKMAGRSMPTFMFLIIVTLVSFAFVAWLSFGKTSYLYRDFMTSLETLFTAIVGNSRFKVGGRKPGCQSTSKMYVFCCLFVCLLDCLFVFLMIDSLIIICFTIKPILTTTFSTKL